MTRCEFEPDADVVILADYGEWKPKNVSTSSMAFRRHIRYKVLKESGTRIADQEIRFLQEGQTEKVISLQAQTINWENGKKQVSKLGLKFLPEERINDQWSRKTFRFRDVKVGSIVELFYEIETMNSISLNPWYFQTEFPTMYSEVRLKNLIQGTNYIPAVRGKPLPIAKKNLRWIAKNVPSIQEEPYSASINDGRPMIRFQLIMSGSRVLMGGRAITEEDQEAMMKDTWLFLNRQLQRDTYQKEDAREKKAFQALVESLVRDALTEEEKISRIYTHVRDHFRWNGLHSTWVWRKPSEIYQNRDANSGEINVMLFSLLEMAGITSRKCFVSSRSHGKPFVQQPLLGQFDRLFCLASVDKQIFLLDATDPYRGYEYPDPDLLNGYFYILQGEKSGWAQIPPKFISQTNTLVSANINQAGELVGELREIHRGYAAIDLHKQLDTLDEETFWQIHHPSLRRRLSEDQWRVARIEASQNESEHLMEFLYPIATDSFLEYLGDRILIDPMLGFGIDENPFLASDRLRPIDFGHQILREHNFTLSKPDGYEIEKLPAKMETKLFGGEIQVRFTCTEEGDKIFLRSQVFIQKPFLLAEEYASIRQMFSRIKDLHTDRIVLRKTGG